MAMSTPSGRPSGGALAEVLELILDRGEVVHVAVEPSRHPVHMAAQVGERTFVHISGLGKVQAPTLVLHSRDDDVIPISEGHILAAGIPGAQFIELDSKNHILLETEPAWERFCSEVLDFIGLKDSTGGEDPAFALLSPREREVLALITKGLGNAEIAERLSISEKTVRNHVSNLFDKLGVWTRAQAMVFANDRGFRSR